MPKELVPFNEGEILEVGKYYNVRCAILEVAEGINYVPIIGIEHIDAQFEFDEKHFHFDGRFAKWTYRGYTNEVITTEKPTRTYNFKGLTVKRRKCRRLTTGLEIDWNVWRGKYKTHWYAKWYATQIGKSCAGKRCPHLGTVMIEQDGRLVCPVHNLEGCIKTEKIIKSVLQQQMEQVERNGISNLDFIPRFFTLEIE